MGASLHWKSALLFALGAVASFHLAFAGVGLQGLVLLYLYCLLRLAESAKWWQAFGWGLGIGLATMGPQLAFFWGIFGLLAPALWTIGAFWPAFFLVLARACRVRWGRVGLALAAPFLWTGLEYFRGELYYLKFTWFSLGYAFSGTPSLPVLAGLGVYGLGFVVVALAAALYLLPLRPRLLAFLALLVLTTLGPAPRPPASGQTVHVAGVQLEDNNTLPAVLAALNRLVARLPATDLFVLSEYTLSGPVPADLQAWCRAHQKFLIVGGMDPLPNHQFYDTAFVVGPTGEVVFKQAKSVPVQFFQDGLPAREQHVWDSPWGKIGIGICYDASYRRVNDELIRQGAQALIYPTMDAAEWGLHEHRINGSVAPMRAAEYHVPLFRLASSGISELVAADGRVLASAGYPGQGESVAGAMVLAAPGRLPLDHGLAPFCTGVTGLLIAGLMIGSFIKPRPIRPAPPP